MSTNQSDYEILLEKHTNLLKEHDDLKGYSSFNKKSFRLNTSRN